MHLNGSVVLWALFNSNINKDDEFFWGGGCPAIHPALFRNYRQKGIGITSDFFPWYQAEQIVLNKTWSSVFKVGFFFNLLKFVAKDFLSDAKFIDTLAKYITPIYSSPLISSDEPHTARQTLDVQYIEYWVSWGKMKSSINPWII